MRPGFLLTESSLACLELSHKITLVSYAWLKPLTASSYQRRLLHLIVLNNGIVAIVVPSDKRLGNQYKFSSGCTTYNHCKVSVEKSASTAAFVQPLHKEQREEKKKARLHELAWFVFIRPQR